MLHPNRNELCRRCRDDLCFREEERWLWRGDLGFETPSQGFSYASLSTPSDQRVAFVYIEVQLIGSCRHNSSSRKQLSEVAVLATRGALHTAPQFGALRSGIADPIESSPAAAAGHGK
ncbi:hypothetical protein ABVK25_003204 [Lepraria finkii]|uniref:Uncharacterized protein n=1 Tax=Lepraria finkii TaxID=1340010 RepID=A0ABR4BJ57_9LECA